MTLILDEKQMTALLDVGRSIEELRGALAEQARGLVQMPPRQTTDAADGQNWLRISQAFLNGSGYMGFKAMNRAAGIGMRYLVGLYRIATGELLALMDANWITTRRTAATSALGTHLLAPAEERRVGVIGAGVQARAFLEAYLHLRPLEDVVVHSPRVESREAFAAWIGQELGVRAEAVGSAEAVAEACPVTVLAMRAPREPVYRAAWLRPGVHVTGLSSVRAEAREVEDECWRRADLVVVDDRGTVGQSGDGRSAEASGAIRLAEVPELWQLEAGQVGRTDERQVTLFKSSGNALQDIAVAVGAYHLAVAGGLGQEIGAFPAVKPYA
ncbi:ornithine cyclodeaminase family protein [Aciditerrimonas ferrireducens]|uniref:Ornithine cyclodeaminase family protein n=1 Tax=Aciditerrimonas ferrireducens TaxID=667306 RepID=A0ABV6C263_9ACTN